MGIKIRRGGWRGREWRMERNREDRDKGIKSRKRIKEWDGEELGEERRLVKNIK